MILYSSSNESFRLEIAGRYVLHANGAHRISRLLIFLELKKYSGWWVTFDNTVTLEELKKLAQWFRYLGTHVTRFPGKMSLGQKALRFSYSPVKSQRGLLFVMLNSRLAPQRKKASGEYHSYAIPFIMLRFSRPELKRIGARLRRELSKFIVKHPERLEDYYKPLLVNWLIG